MTLRHEVAPETWRDNGGKFGEMREFSGILLVTQPVHEQAEVEEFLEKLRGPQGQSLLQPPDPPRGAGGDNAGDAPRESDGSRARYMVSRFT